MAVDSSVILFAYGGVHNSIWVSSNAVICPESSAFRAGPSPVSKPEEIIESNTGNREAYQDFLEGCVPTRGIRVLRIGLNRWRVSLGRPQNKPGSGLVAQIEVVKKLIHVRVSEETGILKESHCCGCHVFKMGLERKVETGDLHPT